MTYTPKPGDRVTSPLLVGEWEVTDTGLLDGVRVINKSALAYVPETTLTPVAPPLPPEPAVGEVVWAGGRYWMRDAAAGGWICGAESGSNGWARWHDLPADAEPVVPVSRVAEWLEHDDPTEDIDTSDVRAREFLAEFGWNR